MNTDIPRLRGTLSAIPNPTLKKIFYIPKIMKITKTLYITKRDDWRAWLKKNHSTKKEVWLIYYKKHTGKPKIPYDDAAEEALCFGWIDSIVKRIDDEKFARKFTPRKDKSRWSELNKKRVRKMIREGRMIKVGLAKFKERMKYDESVLKAKSSKELIVPSDLKKALLGNKKAWENFNHLAPSYKKQYIGWITSAKKEETKKRRLKEAIELLSQNKKLGMK